MHTIMIVLGLSFLANISLAYLPAPAYRSFVILPDTSQIQIGKWLDILADTSAALSFEEVSSAPFSNRFTLNVKENPNFGYRPYPYWVRFSFRSNEEKTMWLEFSYPITDHIEVYITDERENTTRFTAGDCLPFHYRPIEHQNFIFPFHIKANQLYTCYLKIQTEGTVVVPLTLWKPSAFLQNAIYYQMGQGIYVGIIVAMIFYNLFLFFSLRDITYLYYIGCIISIGMFTMSITGQSYQFLWPNSPNWNNRTIPFFVGTMGIFLGLFSRKFLNLSALASRTDKVMIVHTALFCFVPVLSFFLPYRVVIYFAIFFGLGSIILCIVAGIQSWMRKYIPARFFLLAWTAFLVGMFIQAFRSLGIFPSNTFTLYASQIGSALEVVLLSLAIADRINVLKSELAQKELEKERILREQEQEKQKLILLKNQELEILVAERTKELLQRHDEIKQINEELQIQKEELEASREFVRQQNEKLTKALHQVAQYNQKITDSIRYAKRIQEAILPEETFLRQHLADYFVMYRPRDIVSGDFYWATQKGNYFYLALADCTGHGVPGAFMSVVGATFLNQVIVFENETSPNKILELVNQHIMLFLHQDKNKKESTRDGMDITLVRIDSQKQELVFTGARTSLFYVRNGEIFEVKGDNTAIGGGQYSFTKLLQEHVIETENTLFYIFSDGYIDQFGGEHDKKYSKKRLKERILEWHHLHFEEQRKNFIKEFVEWQGNTDQVDDVTLIGFKC
ncbi:MAG: SpoIIE family protein phosphatase [Cytophagales bacterium]|nr:SpoIIE family protein phosphatase [Cytophagales bacterium]MDW8385094.1 7TM diverse intracellular signaling domain-containing protein [Flammeovirgaceae bacterium]